MEAMHLEIGYETELFLLSCLLGAGMGLVYDVLVVLRNTVAHHKIVTFIEDFIYALMFGFAYFTFCTGLTGGIRGFIILGMIVGCVLERNTLGKATVFVVSKIFDVIWKVVFSPIVKILAKIFRPIHRLIVKKQLIFCKNKKTVKKPLKV